MKKIVKYFDRVFRALDIFGEPVTILYRGNSKYNTKTGAFFSLVVGVLLTAAFVINLQRMMYKDDPTIK